MASEKLIKLLQKKNDLNEQIKREEARLDKKKRVEDTRRKILVGAFILDKASRDEQYNGWLLKVLNGYLTRSDGRALFGLPPVWGLPIVGTKTWNSLLKQPLESFNEALCADRNKQFYEEYPFQKVVLTAFLPQFIEI